MRFVRLKHRVHSILYRRDASLSDPLPQGLTIVASIILEIYSEKPESIINKISCLCLKGRDHDRYIKWQMITRIRKAEHSVYLS